MPKIERVEQKPKVVETGNAEVTVRILHIEPFRAGSIARGLQYVLENWARTRLLTEFVVSRNVEQKEAKKE